MASRTSLVFAKGAVIFVGGGFATMTWQDAANEAYAIAQKLMGQEETELFPAWGPIAMILTGIFFGFLAYKTR